MSSITKISIDKAVYEYSGLVWGDLVGETPEKCVGILSAGKGITPKNISDVKSKIQELKKRTPFFVPRVRMEKDYGYGSANAKWLRSLKTRENSLKMSVVYLADAVNALIRKPYTDQIAHLRETVDEESRLKKDGQQLTAEQTAKLEGVEKQVSEIREQMKKLPKCTNAILTTLLHEVVDDMSEEDGSALEEITREISEQSALIEQYTKAKAEEEAKEKAEVADGQEKPVVNEELILRHEHKIADIKKAVADLEKDRLEIYTAYYEKFRREITPQAIANQLTKYPGTFWEAWDINTEMISVSVTMESKKKDDASKSTHEERGLSLMAFPYSINMTSNSKEFLSDLDNDLKVTDDWNRWMKAHRDEKTFTEDYRQAYESHRQRLKTLPMEKEDKADVGTESTQQTHAEESKDPSEGVVQPTAAEQQQTPQEQSQVNFDRNKTDLMTFLNEKAQKISSLTSYLAEPSNKTAVDKFAQREDFQVVFNTLRANVKDDTPVFKIVQFLRNVANHSILEWGASAPPRQ